MKVTNLTLEQLDNWAAKAQKWTVIEGPILMTDFHIREEIHKVYMDGDKYMSIVSQYHPSTNGGQAMELVKKFGICPRAHVVTNREITSWSAGSKWPWNEIVDYVGETPEIAICRAVIVSVYGEEVPE